jgi:hypothetical protein
MTAHGFSRDELKAWPDHRLLLLGLSALSAAPRNGDSKPSGRPMTAKLRDDLLGRLARTNNTHEQAAILAQFLDA